MVKAYWVVVGFGTGLLVGIIVARNVATAPAATEPKVSAQALPAPAPRIEPAAGVPPDAAAITAPVNQPVAATAAPQLPAEPPATPVPVPGREASAFAPSIDSGVVRAIDVGEALAKQIARPSQPGFENPIGDAHRELEREARDEKWAYQMEGELQNSLVSQASMGALKVEHIECRATICEVRLSSTGNQQLPLQAWSESWKATGLDKNLFPNMSSLVGTDDRVDALYIFRRPARTP